MMKLCFLFIFIVYAKCSEDELLRQAKAFQLGQMNVTRDPQKAFDIYQQLVKEHINPQALYELGHMYFFGEPGAVSADHRISLQYVNQSAQLGNSDAQHLLGVWHSTGSNTHVEVDKSKAVLNQYFAALGGHLQASMALGYRHMYGYGVPQSCVTALRYFKFAADRTIMTESPYQMPVRRIKLRLSNNGKQHTYLDDMERDARFEYFSSTGGDASVYSAAKILQEVRRASHETLTRVKHVLLESAEKGHASAMAYLGHMYTYGFGVEKDFETAFEYYSKALAEGNEEAQNGIGLMYMHGYGVEIDYEKAFDYFMRATDQGHPDAVYNAGYLLESTDPTRALKHYEAAGKTGHVKALFKLARAIERGNGIDASCSKSLLYYKRVAEMAEWNEDFLLTAFKRYDSGDVNGAALMFLKAAEEGHEVAQSNIAFILESHTTQLDQSLLLNMYKCAARQGSISARLKLGDAYYYGHWGAEINYHNAAAEYQIASATSGQALYNLGYMHEYGLGVPKSSVQAKMYYKMGQQADRHGSIPLELALLRLKVHSWVELAHRTCTDYTWCASILNLSVTSSRGAQQDIDEAITEASQIVAKDNYVQVVHLAKKAYLEIDPKFHVSGETFTLESWIYIDSNFRGPAVIVSKEDSMGMLLTNADGGVRVLAQYYPDRKGVLSKTALQENAWYHVAVVKHEAYVAVYINGKMDAVRKYRGPIAQSHLPFFVGARLGEHSFFRGKIAQIRIWTSAKTPHDMSELMMAKTMEDREDLVLNISFEEINHESRPEEQNSIELINDLTTAKHQVIVVRRPVVEEAPFPMARRIVQDT